MEIYVSSGCPVFPGETHTERARERERALGFSEALKAIDTSLSSRCAGQICIFKAVPAR